MSKKEMAEFYKHIASILPNVSDETILLIKKHLKNYHNPVPCPICGLMMTNYKGVKVHISRKHQ